MTVGFTRPPRQPVARLPADVADALDASADDLRHGRLEDATTVLTRARERIEARKAAPGTSADISEQA